MKEKITAKKDIARRLKIIEGHLSKVTRMVEEDRYCIDVLQQASAVRSALKKVEELLLGNHLRTCVVRDIKNNGDERSIQELIEVFKRTNR